MKYFYSLDQAAERVNALCRGESDIEPIKLYPESEEIIHDLENNKFSDWWGVYRYNEPSWDFADFDSEEEALYEFYQNEGDKVYCRIYDC